MVVISCPKNKTDGERVNTFLNIGCKHLNGSLCIIECYVYNI